MTNEPEHIQDIIKGRRNSEIVLSLFAVLIVAVLAAIGGYFWKLIH